MLTRKVLKYTLRWLSPYIQCSWSLTPRMCRIMQMLIHLMLKKVQNKFFLKLQTYPMSALYLLFSFQLSTPKKALDFYKLCSTSCCPYVKDEEKHWPSIRDSMLLLSITPVYNNTEIMKFLLLQKGEYRLGANYFAMGF